MTEVTPGSGNVFADLGLKNPEELLAKAELTYRLTRRIKQRDLTQKQAADLLGVDQAKISALTRGHLSGFSIDRLFRFLVALDCDVDVIVKSKPRSRKQGRVRVTAKA